MRDLGGAPPFDTAVDPTGSAPPRANGSQLHPLYLSDVDPASTPAFLDEVQRLDDILPLLASHVGVEAASTRYQGEWRAHDVYLAVAHDNIVHVITIPHQEPADWATASSFGNVVIGATAAGEKEIGLLYLPQGTSSVPAGWRAFSRFMIARD